MKTLATAKKILVFWLVWNRIRNCLITFEIVCFLLPGAAPEFD